MKKLYLTLWFWCLTILSILYSIEVPSMSKVKVNSGNYINGNKEFTGTYLDRYENGNHHERRVGVWKFWYPDGQMKFEGIYKHGLLVSKKCWNSSGEAIDCKMMKLDEKERQRIFKEK